MTKNMDTSEYQTESSICGDSEEDTALLRSMAAEARKFLTGFTWCPPIQTLWLAAGVGGVVAVFLAELAKCIEGEDRYLWVIVGDLPSAYLVTSDIKNPQEAIESYCEIIDGWVNAVINGKGLDDAFPVDAAPTKENALQLAKRLQFLRTEIAPSFAS